MIRSSNARDDQAEEIKRRLMSYRAKVFKYQACKDLYDNLFPSGTQTISDMPKAQSTDYEPERWAQKRIDLKEQMQRDLNEQLLDTKAILSMMCGLEDDEKTVLIRRYMIGENMAMVASKINYSPRWCWDKHDKAIRKIAEREMQKNV